MTAVIGLWFSLGVLTAFAAMLAGADAITILAALVFAPVLFFVAAVRGLIHCVDRIWDA